MKIAIARAQHSLSSLIENEWFMTTLGVSLLFAGAQISIPLQPVPITLQTVSAMLIGLTFSRKAALKSLSAYWILGTAGLPLFANYSSSIAVTFGPSGGYLIGFLVGAYVMTLLKEHLGTSWIGLLTNCFVGSAITFAAGLGWLSTFVGFEKAIALGFVPFIIPGVVKALVLSGSLKAIGLLRFNDKVG
jgi:biotin transport system substrate-specific component